MLNKVLPTWCLCIEASVFPCPKAAEYNTEFTLIGELKIIQKFALGLNLTHTKTNLTDRATNKGKWLGEAEVRWNPAFYRQQMVAIG